MIRPYEVAHPNYVLWEQTIDGYLRSHDWNREPICDVPLQVSSENRLHLLKMYQEVGWEVHLSEVGIRFKMPSNLVKNPYSVYPTLG